MRSGITLIELLASMAVVSLMAAFAVPRFASLMDQTAVRAATTDIIGAFAVARESAMARSTYSTLRVNAADTSVTVALGPDTVLFRFLGAVHGVSVRANRDSISYNALGLGYGAGNQSIIVTRGSATDTVVVSRLGRVRRSSS